MEDFQIPKPQRHLPDINVVPILDMLVSIIFFLLLSTSFVRYTHNSIPPSSKATITDPIAPPPISLKLLAVQKNDYLEIAIQWVGAEPGYQKIKISNEITPEALRGQIKDFIEPIKNKFLSEKTLQIGLSSNTPYQHLVSIMDGAKIFLPDIVLISDLEAQSRFETLN